MDKHKLVLVAPVALGAVPKIDWDACCFCQKKSGKLMCSANNPIVSARNSSYKSLASNLQQLRPYKYRLDAGYLVDILDEGDGIEATFQTNKAKWHKSCSVQYVGDKFKKVLNDLASSNTSTESELPEASFSEKRDTRSTAPMVNLMEEKCFLCGEPGSRKSSLHLCQTDGVYNNIKRCVEFLKDSKLLALLEGGDLSAKEAKYHTTCLARLYNKCRRRSVITNQDNDRIMCEGVAFADMLFYIQNILNESHNFFKMADLCKMYETRLAQLLRIPALRGFRAFTGCDSVSFITSKGKKSAWGAWTGDHITAAFSKLGQPLPLEEQLSAINIQALEEFIVKMYDPQSSTTSVDKARKEMFCRGDKPITLIPPSSSALKEHIKRAAYQAGHIWGQAHNIHCEPPSPMEWGWKKSENLLVPLWSELPPVWLALRELDRCGCKTDCGTMRCCCRRYNLVCTPACKSCMANCSNQSSQLDPEEETL